MTQIEVSIALELIFRGMQYLPVVNSGAQMSKKWAGIGFSSVQRSWVGGFFFPLKNRHFPRINEIKIRLFSQEVKIVLV